MEEFDSIVQRFTERLYEDEQLRSNFNDDEARVVLGWAEQRITAQINAADDEPRARQLAQSEFTRVRQAVKTINALAAHPGALRLSEAIAAFEAQMQTAQVMPRADVFKLLTEFVNALWRAQAEYKPPTVVDPNAPVPI